MIAMRVRETDIAVPASIGKFQVYGKLELILEEILIDDQRMRADRQGSTENSGDN